MTHPDSPQEREREALSDDALLDILRRLNLSGCKAVPLTRTVGPYEITEPTLMACVLADAIWQACAAAKDARIEELERAMKAADSLMRKAHEDHCACEQARAASQAELAAVREDAERYRWLRKKTMRDVGHTLMDLGAQIGVRNFPPDFLSLDTAIDAERAARKETE